jgi:hypothetical protein
MYSDQHRWAAVYEMLFYQIHGDRIIECRSTAPSMSARSGFYGHVPTIIALSGITAQTITGIGILGYLAQGFP